MRQRSCPKLHLVVLAIFIDGKLVSGLDRVMAMHISGGNLIPLLKEADALWL
ncbi:hypothetical protein L7F22_053806 [Adiantum nelumboides]|nr:hypothetical protein [Adiantum nelumboides]